MERLSKHDEEASGMSPSQEEILTGGQVDTARGSMGGPSRTIGIVGGRGETGGGSNADMGGSTGITTAGTAGGTTAAATPSDFGISDSGLTGDLGATTAGPEGDFGDPANREAAAIAAGAALGTVGDTVQPDYASNVADRGTTAGYRAEEPSGAASAGDLSAERESEVRSEKDTEPLDRMDPQTRHVIEGDGLMGEFWEVTNAALGGERIERD